MAHFQGFSGTPKSPERVPELLDAALLACYDEAGLVLRKFVLAVKALKCRNPRPGANSWPPSSATPLNESGLPLRRASVQLRSHAGSMVNQSHARRVCTP